MNSDNIVFPLPLQASVRLQSPPVVKLIEHATHARDRPIQRYIEISRRERMEARATKLRATESKNEPIRRGDRVSVHAHPCAARARTTDHNRPPPAKPIRTSRLLAPV